MKNVIIIGAGQLGSRHLQGVLKYNKEALQVYVSDPSEEALAITEERAEEVENNHTIHYITGSSAYPDAADVVIVATNSNVRELVTNDLLKNTKVKYLVLEKVLFQEPEAYERVAKVIAEHNVQTYVNHPRRLTPAYEDIAKTIKKTNGRSFFSVVGENWDLGCNALHMIDLFVYLSGSSLKSINTDGIDTKILDSKRKGYVEFTGSITGLMDNNDAFAINSFPGDRGALTVHIATNGNRWLVQEGGKKGLIHLNTDDKFAVAEKDFFQDYQSNLTTDIVADLLEKGSCNLPNYSVAAHTHKIFIDALLGKYNNITNLNELKCPIT